MKPEDFKFELLEHAYALRRQIMARTASHNLDPKTCTWFVTDRAWREFKMSADILSHVQIDLRSSRKQLLGLPVRVTVDDEEGTPPVQLLMEPLLSPKRTRIAE